MRICAFIGLILLTSCGVAEPENKKSTVPAHGSWNDLLGKHVNENGLVNYHGMEADSSQLNSYVENLVANAPNSNWTDNEKLAYWINLYNACTIQLVLKYYPFESIKDIGSSIQIPFINTPWQIEFIKIEGKIYDLDDIEHNIIRKKHNEPRIHFALVCAAISCPPLRNEAYVGDRLDAQLTDQAVKFLSDKSKNTITKNSVTISKIFKWYKDDFANLDSIIEYLNLFCDIEIEQDADLDYQNYDWRLNSQ